MVTESRHRHQTSWTSFDTSPFFGGSNQNIKDAVLDIERRGMQSTFPHKRSSVATVATASTSASTLKEGYLCSPTIAHEVQLNPSLFTAISGTPVTMIPMDDLPLGCVASVKSDHFPLRYAPGEKDVYADVDDDNETDFSGGEPRSSLQKLQNRRNSPEDPCLPFALDDLREMATASMNKAMSFWSHIQAFLHQKFNHEDPEKTMGRISCTMTSRPTTIFIIPAMESESKPKLFSGLESLADSLTNPTFLDDDCVDDMSSLTEPPVVITKSLPPIVRYRNSPEQRWANDVSDQRLPNDLDFHDEVDDYIEFESDIRRMSEMNVPLGCGPFANATTGFLPTRKSSFQAARSALSRRLRTFLPSRKSQNQLKRRESTRSRKVEQSQGVSVSDTFSNTHVLQTEPRDLDSVSC